MLITHKTQTSKDDSKTKVLFQEINVDNYDEENQYNVPPSQGNHFGVRMEDGGNFKEVFKAKMDIVDGQSYTVEEYHTEDLGDSFSVQPEEISGSIVDSEKVLVELPNENPRGPDGENCGIGSKKFVSCNVNLAKSQLVTGDVSCGNKKICVAQSPKTLARTPSLGRKSLKGNDYDPEECPANIEIAKVHRKSRRVGREKKRKSDILGLSMLTLKKQEHAHCPHCGLATDLEQMPICALASTITLGEGLPLYFRHLKWLGSSVIIASLILGIYLFIFFWTGTQCQNPSYKLICHSFGFGILMAVNRDFTVVNIVQQFLTITLYFVLWIFLIVYIIKTKKFKVYENLG